MGLLRYRQKRHFNRTPEPKGGKAKARTQKLSFVIQKHAATRLHYDFRLEMEGVLKSWAVPKGIPLQKGEKRLAMQVEDHPLEYASFEGTIPEGNYGAGTVMLWDHGTYEVLQGDPLNALESGKLHIRLHGRKLNGEWTLVRMRGREQGDKQAWLLIKSGETLTEIPRDVVDRSVTTRRTMDDIASGRSRVWKSNRSSSAAPNQTMTSRRPRQGKQSTVPASLVRHIEKLAAEPAGFVSPMKAVLLDEAPKGRDWLFEIKWDGYRAIAVKDAGKVTLFSRTERDVTAEFPTVAEAVMQIPGASFVMDGEIVALDANGRPSFQLLQQRNQNEVALYFYVFDLLNVEDHSTAHLPLTERKELLKQLLAGVQDPVRYSAAFAGKSESLLVQARKNRIEGIIGKRGDSIYESGRRSPAWVKVKIFCEQELVIGGYTEPKGTRQHFGAILVGYYEGKVLRFASKVGTGFDTSTLDSLYKKFQKLKTDKCPFVDIEVRPSSKGGLSPAERRRCTWLEPRLVGQIKFAEWTEDGGLRQPVFMGLRDDKDPREVIRELPAKMPKR